MNEATTPLGAADPAPGALAALSPWRRDLLTLAASLALLIAWDLLDFDLPISGLFADAGGFPLRDQWFVAGVLHSGSRWAAWVIALVLVVGIWKPLPFARNLTRRERADWVAATLACALLIPLLKVFSLTSCPWSLAQFGGSATHVSHWLIGHADGGPGRCFPGGHATAAFCFLPGYFILRPVAPRAARRWLGLTLAAGAFLTWVQVVRGAHYVSHSLWTGWFCYVLSLVSLHALRRVAEVRDHAEAAWRRRPWPLSQTHAEPATADLTRVAR
jgi:membrane-associated PAP2 superfamily phosphatase